MNTNTQKIMNDMIHNVVMGVDGVMTIISPVNAPTESMEFSIFPHKIGVVINNVKQSFLLKDLNLEKLKVYQAIIMLAGAFVEHKLIPAVAVGPVIVNRTYKLTLEICSLMMDYSSDYSKVIEKEIAKKL
ncbi:hypothetical protein [Flavobacterium caseinilyticum]|uniref:Uncharacterized protein n=1 Tax=Flavobacterium caseinilyticum TaxID=2541732 RepID=A0A4R5AU05_9FLAO|nr:hypothetical protein [Flavobacterium caseinilyticum]TDD74604.1 hypothetical protein E0F89_13940 [Flavobacterium caseinilyticum]